MGKDGAKKRRLFSTRTSIVKKPRSEIFFLGMCVLYFPPNRFEEPAWLNEENLIAKAEYIDLRHMVGHTDRKIINYSPLHDNQNWLFEVIYDRAAFEINTRNYNVPVKDSEMPVSLPLFLGYSGQATSIHEVALQIVRSIIRKGPNIRFGIGKRQNRVVSIVDESRQLVPNIFQLSSGETSLLKLFFINTTRFRFI